MISGKCELLLDKHYLCSVHNYFFEDDNGIFDFYNYGQKQHYHDHCYHSEEIQACSPIPVHLEKATMF